MISEIQVTEFIGQLWKSMECSGRGQLQTSQRQEWRYEAELPTARCMISAMQRGAGSLQHVHTFSSMLQHHC